MRIEQKTALFFSAPSEIDVPDGALYFQKSEVNLMNKRVFISSPCRVGVGEARTREEQLNISAAQIACRIAVRRGYIPMAPRLYFPRFLFTDKKADERQNGMEMGLTWLEDCDELWVIGQHISEEMAREIAKASEMGIPVKCVPGFGGGDAKLLAAVKAANHDPTLGEAQDEYGQVL